MRISQDRDSRNPEHDVERVIAGQILIQAMRDYHNARELIKRKHVAFKYHCMNDIHFLDDEEVKRIFDGKSAWEWFVNPPIPKGKGWTLQKCCEMLDLDLETVRREALLESTARRFRSFNVGAYKPNHARKNTRGTKREAA